MQHMFKMHRYLNQWFSVSQEHIYCSQASCWYRKVSLNIGLQSHSLDVREECLAFYFHSV